MLACPVGEVLQDQEAITKWAGQAITIHIKGSSTDPPLKPAVNFGCIAARCTCSHGANCKCVVSKAGPKELAKDE